MTTPSSHPGDEPPRRPGAARVRLVLVLLLLGAWHLRWTTAQTPLGVQVQHGPARLGVVAAGPLLLLWGLAVTVLLARRGAGLRAGAALTDAALAGAFTLLLASGHAWVPDPDRHADWVPVFAPLSVLALLEASARLARSPLAGEVALLRGLSGSFAAVALATDGALLPAGVAAWLGVAPLLLERAGGEGGARRGVEALGALAALLAFLAPRLAAGLGARDDLATGVYEGQYGWLVLSAVLLLLGLVGALRPARGPAASR